MYKTDMLHQILNMLTQESSSLQEDMPLYTDIILTLGGPVLALTPTCCLLRGEAEITNFNVFGLTQPEIIPTTLHTSHFWATETWVCYHLRNKIEMRGVGLLWGKLKLY